MHILHVWNYDVILNTTLHINGAMHILIANVLSYK